MPDLFIPTKNAAGTQNRDITVAFRAVEQWAKTVGKGGISQITSADGTVTVTNPTGPTTDLHVGGIFGGYASLTGPGQTTTPGDLTQAGGFAVNSGAGHFISLNDSTPATAPGSSTFTVGIQSDNNVVQIASGGGVTTTTPYFPHITLDSNAGSGVETMHLYSNGQVLIESDAVGSPGGAGISLQGDGASITLQSTLHGGTAINIAGGDATTSSRGSLVINTSGVGVTLQDTGPASSAQLLLTSVNNTVQISAVQQVKIVSPQVNGLVRIGEGVTPFTHGVGIVVRADDGLFFENLPTINPGGSGHVWNNGGVLNIT